MEKARRTKTCLFLKERILNKRKKSKSRKTDFQHQEVDVNTCSNDPEHNHPYEDNINILHVMADVFSTAVNLCKYFFMDKYDDETPYDAPYENLRWRFSELIETIHNLAYKVHCADKTPPWGTIVEDRQVVRSQMEGGLKPECGNYIDLAHYLVYVAKRNIARSNNLKEKQIHLKKLKLFEALCKVQEIKVIYPAYF